MITCVIETHEELEVECFDIPGVYLDTLNDEGVIILLKGLLAELMVTLVPSLYCKCVINDRKGESLLYVNINRVLSGLLKTSLILYKNLRCELDSIGFLIFPYKFFSTRMLISPRWKSPGI